MGFTSKKDELVQIKSDYLTQAMNKTLLHKEVKKENFKKDTYKLHFGFDRKTRSLDTELEIQPTNPTYR